MVDGWHIHQVAPRQRNVRGDARALGADRLLGNLDQDLLAFLQQFLDGRQRRAFFASFLIGLLMTVADLDIVLYGFHLIKHIGDIEKGRFFQANVNEGRLHPWQDADDATAIDVADNAKLTVAFNVELGNVAALQ